MRKFVFRLSFLASIMLAASACVTVEPEDSTVGDYLSARFAAKTKDVDAAASAFLDAQADAPGSMELLRDAFFFQLVSGDVEQAAPYAERLTKSEAGDDGLSSIVLAGRAIRNGYYASARTYIDRATIAEYLKPTANILRAWAVAAEDGSEAALASLRDHAADEFKGFYPLHQAFFSEQADNLQQARSAYQLSLAMNEGPVEVTAYGAFLERTQARKEVEDFYQPFIDSPGAGRIPARAGLKRLEKGKTSTEYADVSPQKGAAIAFFSLANGFLQQMNSQRAAAEEAGFRVPMANYDMPLALAQVARYIDPSLEDALRFSALILDFYGEDERAIELLSSIHSSSPYYEQAQISIASALSELGREDEAIKILQRIARGPSSADAQLALAGLYVSRNRHEQAVKALDNIIDQLPADPPSGAWRYYLMRGASLLEIDKWPQAEADLVKAVDLAPEEASALNYLGYSWVERGENLEEAFTMIEKAVTLEPNSGPIIDSLGWAHYQRGDYDQAVGHLEHAASLEPGDPEIITHLGDVYWRLGRKLEATYQWRHVLELEPSEKLRAELEDRLANGLPDIDE